MTTKPEKVIVFTAIAGLHDAEQAFNKWSEENHDKVEIISRHVHSESSSLDQSEPDTIMAELVITIFYREK